MHSVVTNFHLAAESGTDIDPDNMPSKRRRGSHEGSPNVVLKPLLTSYLAMHVLERLSQRQLASALQLFFVA